MPVFELVYVDPDTGAPSKLLPDHFGIDMSPVFSSVGAVSFDYPESGVRFDLLRPAIEEKDVEIAVFRDGQEIHDLRFIIEEYSGDEASDSEEGTTWSFTGRTLYSLFERAIVYPPGFGTEDAEDTRKFKDSTAGKIFGTLVAEAQGRGALLGIQIGSFSELTDSNGVAWTKQISIEYRAGLQLSEILQNLRDQGMCEARMFGREIRLYNPDTLSTDRTVGENPVILRKGRDLSDAPRKVSRKEIASVLLAGGSDGLYAEAVNQEALSSFGRWEAFESQGGVSDIGTLTSYAEYQRDLRAQVTMEKSHGLVFDDNTPQPVRDFDLGDWIYSSTDGTLERLRVKQWVVSQGSDGTRTGSVILGDLFSELQDKIVKRVNGILGGTTLTGESRATDVTNIQDSIAPLPPTSLVLTSDAYTTQEGETLAQVSITWTEPTTNEDGSTVTDLQEYWVRYHYQTDDAGEGWSSSYTSGDNSISLSPFLTGKNVDFQVAAMDSSGNLSAWSEIATVFTALDEAPPPVPTQPDVQGSLGRIQVYWDGMGVAGVQMPVDFSHVEVHISSVTDFTPSDATLADRLSGRGYSSLAPVSDPVYNTDNFIKLVSVDRSLNRSDASAQGVGQAEQVVQTDLQDGVIGYDKVRFKDAGNLVADGSFEMDVTKQDIADLNFAAIGVVDDPTTTAPSPSVLQITSEPTGPFTFWLNRQINGSDDQSHVAILDYYAHGFGPDDEVHLQITSHFPDGSPDSNSWLIDITDADPQDAWQLRQAASDFLSEGAYRFSIGIYANLVSADAYVLLDRLEVRTKIGTLVVEDAAIDTAQIANLAVNDAKIADLSAGKITAGLMEAEVLLGGRIATADTGSRVEMSYNGILGWDANGNNTFWLSPFSGDVQAKGEFASGPVGGDRAVLSSSNPWGEPGLWFPQPAHNWGFDATIYSPPSDGSLRMISAEATTNDSGRTQVWLFQNYFALSTEFVDFDHTLPRSEVAASGPMIVQSGPGGLELMAGSKTDKSLHGMISFGGKLQAGQGPYTTFMQYEANHSDLSGAGDEVTGVVSWGATGWFDNRTVVSAQSGGSSYVATCTGSGAAQSSWVIRSVNGGGFTRATIWAWQSA